MATELQFRDVFPLLNWTSLKSRRIEFPGWTKRIHLECHKKAQELKCQHHLLNYRYKGKLNTASQIARKQSGRHCCYADAMEIYFYAQHNFLEEVSSGLMFFIIPWGLMLLALPYIFFRAFNRRNVFLLILKNMTFTYLLMCTYSTYFRLV